MQMLRFGRGLNDSAFAGKKYLEKYINPLVMVDLVDFFCYGYGGKGL